MECSLTCGPAARYGCSGECGCNAVHCSMVSFPGPLRARANQPEWWLLASVLLLLGGFLATNYRTAEARALAAESTRLAGQINVVAPNLERDLATRLRGWTGPSIASSRADFIDRDFSGRNYFQAVRAMPQRATLNVSAPVLSVDDDVVTTVSRILPGPDGLFAGAVVATRAPDYFADALRPLANAPEVWSGLIQGDGLRLTHFPKMKGDDGSDVNAPRSFFRRHIESESDRPTSVSNGFVPSFGQQRLMVLHTVGPLQLYGHASMVVGATQAGRWLQCCDL